MEEEQGYDAIVEVARAAQQDWTERRDGARARRGAPLPHAGVREHAGTARITEHELQRLRRLATGSAEHARAAPRAEGDAARGAALVPSFVVDSLGESELSDFVSLLRDFPGDVSQLDEALSAGPSYAHVGSDQVSVYRLVGEEAQGRNGQDPHHPGEGRHDTEPMTDVPDYPHQAYLDDGGEGNEDEDMLHDNSVDGNSDNDNHDDINDDNDDDDDDNLYDEDFNETLNNDDADDNEDEAVYSEHHVDHAVALELSYLDVARGEDVQGLPWHTLSQTRAEYRSDRIRQYKNHQSILTPNAELDEGNERAAQAIKEKQFYLFHRNTRRVKCDIVHFQLRNLVWATSKHDVYVTYRSRVMHYDALRRIRSLELNLTGTRADSPENTYEAADLRAAGFRSSMASGAAGAGRIPRDIDIDDGERDDEQRQVLLTDTLRALAHRAASDEDYVGLPRDTGLSGSYPGLEFGRTCPQTDELRGRPIQVSTMVARHDLLAAGGFFGEVVVKDLLGGRIVFESRITHDENAITNALEVFRWRTGALRLMACSNDCSVRIFDVPTFKLLNEFKYGWAVNHATLRPGGGKMMCVVGDDMNVLLADADTGAVLERISGHKDFSFASDWHPDGNLFATGNQDCTTRVWDVRHLSAPVRVIKAHLGPMRSVRFSSDGKLLACAEPADFVHIYGVSGGKLDEAQEIDLFGEMAGFSFSPHGESLFVGISDRTYSSLLEYERVGLHCRPCE